jgi:hypothetical protein
MKLMAVAEVPDPYFILSLAYPSDGLFAVKEQQKRSSNYPDFTRSMSIVLIGAVSFRFSPSGQRDAMRANFTAP